MYPPSSVVSGDCSANRAECCLQDIDLVFLVRGVLHVEGEVQLGENLVHVG